MTTNKKDHSETTVFPLLISAPKLKKKIKKSVERAFHSLLSKKGTTNWRYYKLQTFSIF